MPQPPTTYMLLILPTEGGDSDVWDQLVNEAIGGVNGIDAHDHSDGRGKRVQSAGLDINADLSFNGHRITTVRGLVLTDLGGLLGAGAREFFSFGGNVYWRNGAGQNVRITNGATLDVTSVGGIAGDYSAVGAELAYVDASDTYTMRQQIATIVRQFARVACAGVDLFEYQAAGVTPVPANRVRLSSPAALAASYELRMPAALPASQALVQADAAGQMFISDAVPNLTTFTTGAASSSFRGASALSYKFTANYDVNLVVSRQLINFAAGANLVNENLQLALGTSVLPMTLVYSPIPVGFVQEFTVGGLKTSGAGTVTIVLKRLVGNTPTTVATFTQSAVGPIGCVFAAPTPTSWPHSDEWYVLINGGGTTGDEIRNMGFSVGNAP